MNEHEYLPLSLLSQTDYCLRRAALILNERIWVENADTAKGRAEHGRVHSQRVERRGNSLKLYEYTVFSDLMGIIGKCDCIEAQRNEQGCQIKAADFPVSLYPIEYKHGSVRKESSYMVQLCAQAMCLEEMLCTEIKTGYLYYGTTKRREEVEITLELREKVREMCAQMHELFERQYTPKVKRTKSCNACSLKNICLPKLMKNISVHDYIVKNVEEKRL